MGFFFMYNFSMIRENSFEFILYNISLLLLFVKCGLFLFRSTIHKTQSSIKLLMQSYYRLRLLAFKVATYQPLTIFSIPVESCISPIISTLYKCVYGGAGGNRTLVQRIYHNCSQRPILCRNSIIIFIIYI